MLTTSYSLLERLRQPEPDAVAWKRFVSLYTGLLYHWATSWGLQPADASDVLQEVLVVLLRELPKYQRTPNSRFRGWLRGVTRNQVRVVLRKRCPAPAGLMLGDDEPAAPEQEAEETASETALLTRRAAELVKNDFQPATWKAFWETAIENRRADEVAAELGMTAGAVYAARFRVQGRIREELGDFLD